MGLKDDNLLTESLFTAMYQPATTQAAPTLRLPSLIRIQEGYKAEASSRNLQVKPFEGLCILPSRVQ